MSNDFHIIIPARYHSTRFPFKLLQPLAGKPVLQHVYERACEAEAATVTIATDHETIFDAMQAVGASVIMTQSQHTTGTDRLAEAVDILKLPDDAIVVNLQGDEPLLPPTSLRQVAKNLMRNKDAAIATLCEAIERSEDIFNSNIVKVVRDHQDFAQYFSRAPIPWQRDVFEKDQTVKNCQAWFRHIGLYAYKVYFLRAYAKLKPAPTEEFEKLEQLRALFYGYRIHVDVAQQSIPGGIDTPEDLQRVAKIMQEKV